MTRTMIRQVFSHGASVLRKLPVNSSIHILDLSEEDELIAPALEELLSFESATAGETPPALKQLLEACERGALSTEHRRRICLPSSEVSEQNGVRSHDKSASEMVRGYLRRAWKRIDHRGFSPLPPKDRALRAFVTRLYGDCEPLQLEQIQALPERLRPMALVIEGHHARAKELIESLPEDQRRGIDWALLGECLTWECETTTELRGGPKAKKAKECVSRATRLGAQGWWDALKPRLARLPTRKRVS